METSTIEEARAALGRAQQQLAEARGRSSAAIAAQERGRSVVAEAERDLAARVAELEAEQSAQAATAAEQLASGTQPRLRPSKKLESIRDALAQARDQRESASAAAGLVAEHLLVAQRELRESEHRMEVAIVGVLQAEGVAEVAELEAAREVVERLEGKLRALGRLPIGQLGGPLRDVVMIAGKVPQQYPSGWDPESVALLRLRAYRESLRVDADARWEDAKPAPQEPAPPRVQFRPSSAPIAA